MRYVLIRDDDLNFFTPFTQLEAVYGFMFDRGIPVNFSAIPAVNGSAVTRDPSNGREVFEPFLPTDVAGCKGNFALDENTDLLAQLRHIKSNEFLHHGYEHSGSNGLCEFESRDKSLLEKKLSLGRDILSRCFGYAPDTFVAPQDKYSPEAIELIRAQFNTFSLGWIDRRRLPVSLLWQYALKKVFSRNRMRYGELLMTEHPGCHYSRYVPRAESDQKLDMHLARHDVSIIVTHHWEFFDQGKLIKPMWDAFKARVLKLQADPQTRIITFSQMQTIAA